MKQVTLLIQNCSIYSVLSCDYCMFYHVTIVCFVMWVLYVLPCDYCMICHVTIVWFIMWLLYDFSCDYCMISHVTIVWFCHVTIAWFVMWSYVLLCSFSSYLYLIKWFVRSDNGMLLWVFRVCFVTTIMVDIIKIVW